MFGYFDFGFGTEDGVDTLGTGGGRGAILIPFKPGIVEAE